MNALLLATLLSAARPDVAISLHPTHWLVRGIDMRIGTTGALVFSETFSTSDRAMHHVRLPDPRLKCLFEGQTPIEGQTAEAKLGCGLGEFLVSTFAFDGREGLLELAVDEGKVGYLLTVTPQD